MSFLHRLWRLIPPGPRRRAMYEIGGRLAPKITRTPRRFDGTIGVVGELGRHSGLGIAARIMADALAGCGATVSTFDIGTLTEPRRLAQDEHERLAQVSTLAMFVNAPQLPIALRRLGRRHITDQRVIGCWAWELPTMPPIWRAGLRSVHEIWAPSHFTAGALGTLITDNAPLPVTVIPHPLAATPPKPSRLARSAFGLPEGPVIVFACFSLASSFARKNPLGAIAAFREAFGVRGDRLLVLKISDADSHPGDMAIIRDAVANARNIRLETHDLSGPDLHALMAASDIILSLHRSEGFGLVPAEAMMLSRAVVATDWSATAEWLDTECGLPVRYRLIPAKDQRGVFEARNAFWADPDIGDAAAQLRRAADDPDLRARLGMAAAERANHAFGTASLQARLAGLAS